LKQIVPNRWTGIVIEKRETFVANSVAEFSDVFPDHAQIDALGLGSVVNLPVILRGDFLGTVNLLHSKAYFQPARLRALAAVEAAAQLAFLLNKQTATAVNAG
jgi:GAF domain-containing protein